MQNFNFKVNLKGMIDLLSNHLYSTPHVYIRELLQNGVDAITARKKVEPAHEGRIEIEVFSPEGQLSTLYIEDNGIGLTEEEVHQFLAQIGQTSKRGEDSGDFIGRFGVGLLSCFIVSDEIVLITRSIKGEETIEWRGKPDGSYTIRKLESEMRAGTRIYLQSKEGFEQYFAPDKVQELIQYYGEFLPYPLLFQGEIRLNAERAPWEMSPLEALAYGKTTWEQNYLDAIPLHSSLGDAKGMAYILPHPVSVSARKAHRVYVKQMLLSENVEKILPDWAFFVTGVLNVNQLQLTASREEFYEDAMLDLVRQELGGGLKRYLVQLAEQKPELLREIIRIHYSSIKQLALEEDELYALFIDWLPFETSLGRITMGEIRKQSMTLYYTASLDEFRQISQVAKAQAICVINGGYVHDTELVQKLKDVFPHLKVERVDPTTFTQKFTELTLGERGEVYELVRLANGVLQPYQCSCEVKRFQPEELSALYTTNQEALFWRSAQQTKEKTNDLFAGLIDQLSAQQVHPQHAQLCLNYENPLIQKLIRTSDTAMKKTMIEMIYVQALLLGHHPLRQGEMKLLNQGLLKLMEQGLK